MSMFSGLTSMFAQPAFQAVAAGLLTGAVIGSTMVASGILPLEPQREDPKFVALLACPGGGPELARVPAGQQLLITARSEDGAWLEVYIGEPGVEFAWAPAPAFRAASALDALPVSACDTSQTFLPTLGPPEPTVTPTGVPATVLPTLAPTLGPGATASPTPRPTPTPKVTQTPNPTPTKKPPTAPPTLPPTAPPITAPPDTTDPVLSGLTANPTCVGPDIAASRISVQATDNVAVLSVSLGISPPGASAFVVSMTHGSGNTWFYDVFNNGAWGEGHINYTVTAQDFGGNTSDPASSDPFSSNNYLYHSTSACIIG